MLITAVTLMICVPAPLRLCAQTPDSLNIPRTPPAVHYGKWVALGGSVALGVLSQRRHSDADDTFDALQLSCDTTPTGCALVNGHYLDPGNERLYQDTRRLDHEATRYLIGAETLFAAAAAGFIWELFDHRSEPKNIPLAPRIEPGPHATRVSLTVRF